MGCRPAKYSGAKLTIQRLADPKRASEVSEADIIKTFTKPNQTTKDIMKELGPSVGSNILYAALSKVRPGDYDKMADTILELKRTKGFDRIVTPNMEAWANAIQSKSKKLGYIRKGLMSIGGATLGGALLGEHWAALGALAPFASKSLKSLLSKYKKQ